MKLTKQQYANLIHNCALVYNAVPRDVYMKFHRNVNKSDWKAITLMKYDCGAEVIWDSFSWTESEEKWSYWHDITVKY